MIENDAIRALSHFGITPQEIHVIVNKKDRNVWKVINNSGEFALKRVENLDRAFKIASVSQYLSSKGLSVMRILPSKNGHMVVKDRSQYYLLSPWIQGINPRYKTQGMVENIITFLAKFHLLSKGYICPTGKNQKKVQIEHDWESEYKDKSRELEIIYKMAVHDPHPIPQLFMNYYPWLKKRIQWVQDYLPQTAYSTLIKKAKKEPMLIHRDFKSKNLLVDEHGNLTMLDLDYLCNGLPLWDLAKIISSFNHQFGWSENRFHSMLNIYERTLPLTKDEHTLLLMDLVLPRRPLTLIQRYCEGKRNISLEKLDRSIKIDQMTLNDLNIGPKLT
ncbi:MULTISPECIES: CotS family spore coat protein [unclassified Paenibacillus]|uniref:CotS family spore coat protein n=1 Tax=unclassified Paenibacillus TaxID=185978 RepID=UPI001AE1A8C2|nr:MULTISPECIES: CotS family spore coat protein [unclassified Paenibacillus]MBP1155391.1 CotS family spore coat protein [Paenibacillus sp. PvP091]MBP1169224.1 CotS family spore coat protein [Paenibacillus sp. PvR098]MBP2440252.1 CotS family spore coat protein [Paenibacillus sp. PvP052]